METEVCTDRQTDRQIPITKVAFARLNQKQQNPGHSGIQRRLQRNHFNTEPEKLPRTIFAQLGVRRNCCFAHEPHSHGFGENIILRITTNATHGTLESAGASSQTKTAFLSLFFVLETSLVNTSIQR